MNPSEVNESYTITAGVYTKTDGVYVDTSKTLTFDSRAECQVWARDAQADGHSTGVHDHWNAAGDVYYDNVNRVFTWTEYGPELDAGTVEGLCMNKVEGVTKTIDETNYYQDKTNLYLKIINIVTNDDTDFDAIRGFWVKDGESCYCLFDDEATVDGQTMNDPASGGGGTGLISSSDYTEGHCYKFDGQVEAVTTSEAPSLSSSPSSQPSTNPSSSSEPSLIPSESPSISANPTTPICSQTIADEIGCNEILDVGYSGHPDWFFISGSTYAGLTLCVPAGSYSSLSINYVEGLVDSPVTIINCGGQVLLDGLNSGLQGTDHWNTLSGKGSRYIHLTGTGDPSHKVR